MNNKKIPPLILLMALVAFPQISETIYTPSLPHIAQGLLVPGSMVQLTLSIYFIGFAFGVFFFGWLSDLTGRRPAMLAGLVVYGIGSMMCYWSGSIEWLLASRLIQAFGAAVGSVITQTILRESVSGNKRHAMFAQISAVIAFTPAVGPLIGGFTDQLLGYKAVFILLIAMSVLLLISTYAALPETMAQQNRIRPAVAQVALRMLRSPRVLVFGVLIGGINGIIFSYYAEAPFIFISYFQLTPGMYGFLGIIVASAAACGAAISKKLLNRYTPVKIIYLGCFVMITGAVVLTIAAAFVARPGMIEMLTMLAAMFVLLLGAGIALPNCLSLALNSFQDVIGTAGAIFSLGYYLLVSLMTWGISLLHNDSLLTMPVYFLALSLIMYVLGKKFITTEEKANA